MIRTTPPCRAMSLVELMLAMTITSMVALAITGMLHAMTTGVVTKRDWRDVMVRSSAAESRLTAYIAPSRCLLAADSSNLVLWFDDSRQSETVQATEVRWLQFDGGAGAIDVFFVHFPDAWSQTEKDLADLEYSASENWALVLQTYQDAGYVDSIRLVDGLQAVTVQLDQGTAAASRHVQYELAFTIDGGASTVNAAATIMAHRTPIK